MQSGTPPQLLGRGMGAVAGSRGLTASVPAALVVSPCWAMTVVPAALVVSPCWTMTVVQAALLVSPCWVMIEVLKAILLALTYLGL